MLNLQEVRNFGRLGDTIPIPSLTNIQTESYARFLQQDVPPDKRENSGLEALLREVFPIQSYDGNMSLEYVSYDLSKPRYTPDECRQLRLTYGMPFRVHVRLVRKDRDEISEDAIYLGELPVMMGGGEFIINGAERVIVNQLHRSPGVDFIKAQAEGDRALHGCRIIPERGSWIEINVTKKDVLAVRIDQSAKIAATTFLRAMGPEYASNEAIIKTFYDSKIKSVKVGALRPDMYAVSDITEEENGEVLVKGGCQIGDAVQRLQKSGVKSVAVIEQVPDPLILNTMADDGCHDYESALLKIYAKLRPGNPPQLEKAQKLFHEKFFDENRYRLGKVGRFRLNRKFNQNVPETEMTLRVEDVVNSLRYVLLLRSGESIYEVDDIDHLGNRRLRTIDELAAEEMRKGFLKLRRTVQERMSLKDPDNLGRIAELVNSKSISSSIEFFFGRGELSQVVDQTNPLSQLTHERRLSALGPGGLNRKRAGFEVRDVHISHYGRICPIETPEGTNIGLIASLSIYSTVDDYGFLVTPYRKVEKGRVNGNVAMLRADEEMRAVLAPPESVEPETGKVVPGPVLARVNGELAMVESKEIDYIDISPKQTVGVSAALIPFLEHDDANRALMGSNMQRQAVPLLRCEPPIVATGMEKLVPLNSGMVIRASRGGTITAADAMRIEIDGTDEYILRKFQGLNERTCLNQKPVVSLGQKVKAGEIIADGPACKNGELALGRNVLVAFMTFDGYNFEDAILISERLLKDDVFTSIHIDQYDIEIRETKLGREEFTRDIPNVSEKALANLDENGIVRIGTRVGPGDILVGKVSPKSKSELSPEEKLLYAIFGRAGEDVKNDSLELPAGEEGVVIDTKWFSRRMHLTDEQKKNLGLQMKEYKRQEDTKIVSVFRKMCDAIEEGTGQVMVDPSTKQKVGKSESMEVILEQVESFKAQIESGSVKWIKPASVRDAAMKVVERYWPRIRDIIEERERKLAQMKRGDELPSGVLEMVKVYVATKRQLAVGDKMAGRHGNKGVIAKILPKEDMPFLPDGRPVQILLNPLGVPSRMNVGQILE
ncbi:MAG: DNA-directed RNA polymerase subunit beta, partial [Phycisphaerae bacterium]|nr:DNA-directed RNA polymerase subunit beta [Phycisphaerae bacterium]